MRDILFVLAILLAGCGAEPSTPPAVARTVVRDASADVSRDSAIEGFDPLAIDSSHLAPGMREVIKSDIAVASSGASVAIPVNADADVCVRVAVRPISIRARLTVTQTAPSGGLAKGGVLGEGPTIGDKGPVCVRKGDALTVELASDAPVKARVMVWSSP